MEKLQPKLLLRYDCAVIQFLLLDFLLGIQYPLKNKLLAFASWTSVGNSNWYITAILMLYICFWISFKISLRFSNNGTGRKAGLVLLIILTVICILGHVKIGRPEYCYNTMMIFPFGVLYSEYRSYIDNLLRKYGDSLYFIFLLFTLGIYIVFFFHRWKWGIEGYTIWAAAFTGLILLTTMKVSVYNGLLEWFGKHVFSLYILQRLPMIILGYFNCIESHKYISLIVVSAVIALTFEKITDILINRITHCF